MRRNDDLLREILMEAEAADCSPIVCSPRLAGDRSELEKLHHCELLCDSGLMVEVSESCFRLTSDGHDYLKAIRDEGIWARTKAAIAETGGNASLQLVQNVATAFVKKKISDHTGLTLQTSRPARKQ